MPDLDHDALGARVARAAAARLPGAEVEELRRLPGGLSSLTYVARLAHGGGTDDVVVKVAPPGLPPRANRDVLRQAWILDALAGLPGFPVPRVLFRDAGEPPEIPPLFGMTRAAGQAYEPRIDVTEHPPAPEVAAERMRAAARALAALHAAGPAALGLDDDVVTPAEECARWTRLLATIDESLAPGHGELARRLAERVPDAQPARVHHGDYRVANMLFTGATLNAVVDWEIWSVGDPRFDLAWLAMHTDPVHRFHDRRPPGDEAAGSALPGRDEIVAEYLAAGGTATPDDLAWFTAASQYKGVSTVAALYKRERQRADPDPLVMTVGAQLPRMLEVGHAALDARGTQQAGQHADRGAAARNA